MRTFIVIYQFLDTKEWKIDVEFGQNPEAYFKREDAEERGQWLVDDLGKHGVKIKYRVVELLPKEQ